MTKDTHTTEVIFRKLKQSTGFGGTIDAYFPYILEDRQGYKCSCYSHVGQHSAADYQGMVNQSVPATEEEYKDLKAELENYFGYNLKVIKRANSRKLSKARQELRDKYKAK